MKKKLHCAYLFADGHAVLVYEKHDRRAGDTHWAEAVEKFGPECRFTGCIVFHRGSSDLLNLCRKAEAVRATAATLEIQLTEGRLHNVWVQGLSCVLGTPYTYQPEQDEKFDPEISHWADCRVAKVHRLPAKRQPTQAEPGTDAHKP
jgi:prepilin-type processing-associated H-X9-DG protein